MMCAMKRSQENYSRDVRFVETRTAVGIQRSLVVSRLLEPSTESG
jgi:hypothetical protein